MERHARGRANRGRGRRLRASRYLKARVTHHRAAACEHGFRRGVGYYELDLGELEEIFGRWPLASTEFPGLLWFRRSDYIGPAGKDLDLAVRDLVEREVGRRPAGAIRLVTQVRTLGYLFNPVSFYLCLDESGALDVFVAQITNTPWGERHAYVLDARKAEHTPAGLRWRFDKEFHVSPFFPMEQVYEWTVAADPERLAIHMTNFEGERIVFTAGFEAERRALGMKALLGSALRHPLQPLRIHLSIYFHAARLWLKRAPFFSHPDKRISSATGTQP